MRFKEYINLVYTLSRVICIRVICCEKKLYTCSAVDVKGLCNDEQINDTHDVLSRIEVRYVNINECSSQLNEYALTFTFNLVKVLLACVYMFLYCLHIEIG